MKTNKAVLRRVEKFRQRRGFKIIDSNSGVYKLFKALYFLSFLWYVALITLIVLPIWIFPEELGAGFDSLHKWFLTGLTVFSIGGGVVLMCRQHLIGGIMNLMAYVASLLELKFLMHNNRTFDIDDVVYDIFGEQILANYIWRHVAPCVLGFIFMAVMCFIYYREKYYFKRDYNRVLDALYITYKDQLGSGSEAEWEALLESLDDDDIESELDKQATREFMAKKEKNKPSIDETDKV